MTTDHTIDNAITESIREDRTVTLYARYESLEWTDAASALNYHCDDWMEEERAEPDAPVVHRFWGTDEDGHEWSVALVEEAA